ncbi:expressed unknown protein [Seminavis robusta]|uniref:Uncharacterized protein n=1 Tax=Seminavis robusta TaxID=568900 RepID=A0A9N8HAE9_9STRA|nr:expressed unknown protein [Seminavis robusta]|eukprot:Sro293_g109950.1 n/a (565) ;mRNA; r:45933-47703
MDAEGLCFTMSKNSYERSRENQLIELSELSEAEGYTKSKSARELASEVRLMEEKIALLTDKHERAIESHSERYKNVLDRIQAIDDRTTINTGTGTGMDNQAPKEAPSQLQTEDTQGDPTEKSMVARVCGGFSDIMIRQIKSVDLIRRFPYLTALAVAFSISLLKVAFVVVFTVFTQQSCVPSSSIVSSDVPPESLKETFDPLKEFGVFNFTTGADELRLEDFSAYNISDIWTGVTGGLPYQTPRHGFRDFARYVLRENAYIHECARYCNELDGSFIGWAAVVAEVEVYAQPVASRMECFCSFVTNNYDFLGYVHRETYLANPTCLVEYHKKESNNPNCTLDSHTANGTLQEEINWNNFTLYTRSPIVVMSSLERGNFSACDQAKVKEACFVPTFSVFGEEQPGGLGEKLALEREIQIINHAWESVPPNVAREHRPAWVRCVLPGFSCDDYGSTSCPEHSRFACNEQTRECIGLTTVSYVSCPLILSTIGSGMGFMDLVEIVCVCVVVGLVLACRGQMREALPIWSEAANERYIVEQLRDEVEHMKDSARTDPARSFSTQKQEQE